ncbi:MAG TPA: Wzt carbohydrate-binding domain-containing protein, partial [Bacteroidota bacterium]|nr:Wzt carbohydrate-binding domain-containing protein [Bacteroidota bacterium]
GYADVYGRVGSLLEVGTGFHPELTGRENIFLNGAILGMKRIEIDKKFDEIVAFAEVEKFIDTPVKHYSSGMHLRLAFAVAAHLQPDILLVDEVLAVGDADFQKKCLGKMGEVAKEGRTVLFVSHNMGIINQICPQTILLNKGLLATFDSSEKVVKEYLMHDGVHKSDIHIEPDSNKKIAFTRVWIADQNGKATSNFDVRRPFSIHTAFLVQQRTRGVDIAVRVRNSSGVIVFTSQLSSTVDDSEVDFHPGNYVSHVQIPAELLAPDSYSLMVAIHIPFVTILDRYDEILRFNIDETGSLMSKYRGGYGCILVRLSWDIERKN